jgi:DNA replication and repair protein RecF
MLLHWLYLENFRSYKERTFHFFPKINWIIGPNAVGKTNLLEALSLLSTGRSFRTANLTELIREGESHFYIETEFEKDGVKQRLALSFDGNSKQMVHNMSRYTHFTPLLGLLPTLILLPEDGALIWGAPAYRRRCMNLHIAQEDPLYVPHLMRYHKALEHRNQLLRHKSIQTIDPWELLMAESGAFLMDARRRALESLAGPLMEMLQRLSGGTDQLQCSYQSSLPLRSLEEMPTYLKEEWQKQRPRELHLGATQLGPHRDDMKLFIGKKLARQVASQGQKHSIAASLRLAQWQLLRESTGYPPLFCIDDFGIHLDPARQHHLQNAIGELGQVFLTAPRAVVECAEMIVV